ncbi:MAG TPA: AraC family transcriptional regulator [Thermoanaerobaculia bacterium]|nr:AraC family transcriptional regulator [Thermoanaerobaculia bacterium]
MRDRDWARFRRGSDGVELFEADFDRHVFDRHIHDAYAIGFTLRGVQRFWCRGARRDSTPGNVIVIHPGEMHDGESGAAGGFAYRMFYVSDAAMRNIVNASIDARAPVLEDARLARQLDRAWCAVRDDPDSLAAEELLQRAFGSLAVRHAGHRVNSSTNSRALLRVREYLHERARERVTLRELAAIASMSRFQLTRQFQKQFGLPLHAYHLHVRLDEAKRRLRGGEAIANVATDLGFTDQSHLHRRFKGAFGITPGEWKIWTTGSARASHDRD